jgi:hypothetical protein
MFDVKQFFVQFLWFDGIIGCNIYPDDDLSITFILVALFTYQRHRLNVNTYKLIILNTA